jgi:putative Mg2+ transporter-C (MgtC) family protein
MELELQDVALRLGAATAAGTLIGLNRDVLNKPIGMRTLGMVGLGTAIVTIAGIQVSNLAEHPDALSRVVQGIIQGIMAGISFIGAGVILRDPESKTVDGLTTAATVWVTAALGISCGFGQWALTAGGIGLTLLLLVVVPWLERLIIGGEDERKN